MLKTTIEHAGQTYVDEPVMAMPKESMIERAVCMALKGRLRSPVLLRHERVRLRWLKPDGRGGLTPR